MSQILGKCVGLISGGEWRAVRGAAEGPFTLRPAVDRVDLIQNWVERHMADLWKHGRLSEGLLDPAQDLKMLPFWIVAEVIYTELSQTQMTELRELAALREDIFKIVIHGGLTRFSLSRYFPTKANKQLARFQALWRGFNARAYQDSISKTPRAPIVSMYKQCEDGIMTHEQMLHTLDESLFANLDVTTGGISWVLTFLAANKDYQDRLRAELALFLAEGHGGRQKYILANSTLLAACIVESSRLRPLAAFSVPQSAPTPRVVGGYLIPAGTDFIVDAYGLNVRNKGFWGPDASEFRPERFLEGSKRPTNLRYFFWRFGFGPRQCMGRYIAEFMIRALVIHLVENYDLALQEKDTGRQWDRAPDVWINHPKMDIICRSRNRACNN
ncbi:cytochrome P450 monooxygenase [Diaporthe helianthi]|uniref:Cytochrome P450 monooxygenase n=1 Tax=Diaporthe helianthi TaxID=158607 RepID=A0A2P5HM10_DIAHE|nr:cytochrome P450 monooxygenase [Diaporthe helianthi]